jgi:hypothetical protein
MVILLVAIIVYSINGYWWLLMAILLVAIGGYWWLLVVILLLTIGGYSISDYCWLFY